MSYYGHQQSYSTPVREKNPITQSMISTVSEAFEFEDFLGQKTTLKDRVPKNKAKLDPTKKIIHFSREVTEQPIGSNNALSSYTPGTSFSNKNTFENYMNDDFYQTTTYQTQVPQSSYSYNSSSNNYPTKSYQYTHPTTYYDVPKYTQTNRNQPISSYSNLTYTQKQPTMNHSASGKLSFGDKSGLGGSRSKSRGPYQNLNSNNYTNTYTSYGITQKPNYQFSKTTSNYNYGGERNYTESSSNSYKYYQNQGNDYEYKPSGVNNNPSTSPSYSIMNNYANTYGNNTYSGSSYNQKQYEAPIQPSYEGRDRSYDRSYQNYGDYAKDFSSPDILAILNKRKRETESRPETVPSSGM